MDDCPREIQITSHNQAMDWALDVPTASLTIEDIDAQTKVVEWTGELDDFFGKCKTCGGMVVDLSNGKLYCGQAVPPEVTASNERILQN